MTPRVVFDCNVFFQALISPNGPAGRCWRMIKERKAVLFVSTLILEEFASVCLRPALKNRFAIFDERLDAFLASIELTAVLYDEVPKCFEYPRDPDDAHYVNLAIATRADLLVSRDKDLLALADGRNAAKAGLAELAPKLRILSPGEFLSVMDVPT